MIFVSILLNERYFFDCELPQVPTHGDLLFTKNTLLEIQRVKWTISSEGIASCVLYTKEIIQ